MPNPTLPPYIPPHLRPATTAPADTNDLSTGDLVRELGATGLRVAGPMLGMAAGGALGTLADPVVGPAGTYGGGVAGGALGGALSEYLAEKLEPTVKHDKIGTQAASPGRILVAGGLGAIPGSSMVRAGKPLASGALGAGLGYVGVAGNKKAEGEDWEHALNPAEWKTGEILGGPVMGAASGALLGALLRKTPPPSGPTTPPLEVETTAHTGGTTLGGGKVTTGPKGKVTLSGAKPTLVNKLATPTVSVGGELPPPTGPVQPFQVPVTSTDPIPESEVVSTPQATPVGGTPAEASARVQKVIAKQKAELEKEGVQQTRNDKARNKFITDNLVQDTRNEKATSKFIGTDAAQTAKNLNAADDFNAAKAEADAEALEEQQRQDAIQAQLKGLPNKSTAVTTRIQAPTEDGLGVDTLTTRHSRTPPPEDAKGTPNTPVPSKEPEGTEAWALSTRFTNRKTAEQVALQHGLDMVGTRGSYRLKPFPTETPAPMGFAGSEKGDVLQSKLNDILEKVGDGPVEAQATPAAVPSTAPETQDTIPAIDPADLRSPKELEDVMERTGVSTGAKPFEPGKVVSNPSKGLVLSSDSSTPEGKVKWNRAEFGKEPVPETTATPAPEGDTAYKGYSIKHNLTGQTFIEKDGHHISYAKNNADAQATIDQLVPQAKAAPATPESTPQAEPNSDDLQKMSPEEQQSYFDRLRSGKGGIDPHLMVKLGLGLGGAATGAYADPDHPLSGAIIGGLVGAGVPTALSGLGKANLSTLATRLPDFQRFNYLSDPSSLIANTIGAPVGLGTTTALEHILQGDSRGWSLLKNMKNLPKGYLDSMGEAGKLLQDSPMNVAETLPYQRAKTPFDKMVALPAQSITSAHIALRNEGLHAGFTPEESIEMALGNEPGIGTGNQTIRALGQGLQKMKSTKLDNGYDTKNVIGNLVAPFTRTASNVAAATPTRTPGLGLIMKLMSEASPSGKSLTDEKWAPLLAQQGLGTGISGVSYALGANTDPESAKYVRKWVRNLSGRYGLVATAAFEAGQAARAGKSQLGAATQGLSQGLPMPTAEPIKDWATFIKNMADGKVTVPRSLVPSFAQDAIKDSLTPANGYIPAGQR